MTTVPEVVGLSVGDCISTGEDQTEKQHHDSLEKRVDQPAPEDLSAETLVIHAKSVVVRFSDEGGLSILPIEQRIPLDG